MEKSKWAASALAGIIAVAAFAGENPREVGIVLKNSPLASQLAELGKPTGEIKTIRRVGQTFHYEVLRINDDWTCSRILAEDAKRLSLGILQAFGFASLYEVTCEGIVRAEEFVL